LIAFSEKIVNLTGLEPGAKSRTLTDLTDLTVIPGSELLNLPIF
jgi:hypothetical protein